jgi:hypothetical protein
MSEHTPGPWAYRRGSGVVYRNDGVRSDPIARYVDPWNGDLLAAAIDLLAALERMVELHYRDDYLGISKDIQQQAQAAIAKARGEVQG